MSTYLGQSVLIVIRKSHNVSKDIGGRAPHGSCLGWLSKVDFSKHAAEDVHASPYLAKVICTSLCAISAVMVWPEGILWAGLMPYGSGSLTRPSHSGSESGPVDGNGSWRPSPRSGLCR